MLRSFLRMPFMKFSAQLQNAYILKYKVKDFTKLRGINTDTPYIVIEGQKITIPKTNLIANVIADSPFFKPNEPIRINFLDLQHNLYLPASPALALLQNSFYVKLNNELYYVANQQPLIKSSMNAQFIATDAPAVLQPILEATLKQLDYIPDFISPSNLQTIIIKNVMSQASLHKVQKVRLKELIRITDNRIQEFNKQIETINEIALKKASNKTRIFSSFMVAQYALMHYLIYSKLSWDIMEPISVILTNLDILIGYYFFVFKGREYSLEELQKSMEEKQKYQYLKKYKFDLQKYEELLQLKNHFQFRLDLLTKSPFVLMDTLQKPISLLDTR